MGSIMAMHTEHPRLWLDHCNDLMLSSDVLCRVTAGVTADACHTTLSRSIASSLPHSNPAADPSVIAKHVAAGYDLNAVHCAGQRVLMVLHGAKQA